MKSLSLLNILADKYVDYPILRVQLLFYLYKIGYRKSSSKVVLEILDKIDIFDDLSLYQLCFLVTRWEVPSNKQGKAFLKMFEAKITSSSFKGKSPLEFYSLLWFKAKYNPPDKLLNLIKKYENLWQTNSFLRRQVTAILSRLFMYKKDYVKELLFNQLSSGITNTTTLANQILYFSKINKVDKKLSFYLFPTHKQSPYPLGKFLVLCSVLNSEIIRTNKQIQAKVKKHITDPYYLKWLDSQYSIK